ncbi:signal peptidase I [Sporosarcina sp. NCCP-2716]|uniref:signal peptidase I n=1 Tax=Sporosarcina sp. NCCP-2716 TaxID=2943679 RepID=UPI00203ED18C|nr:signal peptidase I [Sporosarcina sp. NCCP-2716]GKV69735.1 signal peptidase I [Sporosarcina sp. NCCP-2716]
MQNSTKKEIMSWVKPMALAVILVVICRQFLFSPVTVHGVSMEPTFDNNQRVIVSKTSSAERFDMIVFGAPDAPGKQYVKRVIGLPGDRIEMKDDKLYVNGEFQEEPYVNRINDLGVSKITGDFTLQELTGETTVPEGTLFVLGDNRLKSNDSRAYGFVEADSIFGVVKLRIYPIKEVGIPR